MQPTRDTQRSVALCDKILVLLWNIRKISFFLDCKAAFELWGHPRPTRNPLMHLSLRPFLFSVVYSIAPGAIYGLQKAPVAKYFLFYETNVIKHGFSTPGP
jgi:hypothetical protein